MNEVCPALVILLTIIGEFRRQCLALYGLYVLIYSTLVLGQDMQISLMVHYVLCLLRSEAEILAL